MRLFVLLIAGLWLGTGGALADGDATKGEQVAKQCMACHSLTDKANRVGPSLVGVAGNKPGSAAGFNYSEAFKAYAANTPVWDDAALTLWLKNPRALVPGTRMAFAGIKDDTAIADLIAFLKTKK